MIKSSLYDEKTFYQKFIEDLSTCQKEVIIESPFISTERAKRLYPTFEKLVKQGVRVYVLTRDPREHSQSFEVQSEFEIRRFEVLGVQVFICTGNHHRKLAILDRKILWEGSLNILSQIKSREIMRRIEGKKSALEMFRFLKLGRFIKEGV
ncbi:MAG TPA: phospholipase D-like domain-containing protein [Patescibacteria group bacterium]|nr:phospholipase D-like domain-containing protein [Patescibacteria group bacterium]